MEHVSSPVVGSQHVSIYYSKFPISHFILGA
jgi:hypothetical protein